MSLPKSPGSHKNIASICIHDRLHERLLLFPRQPVRFLPPQTSIILSLFFDLMLCIYFFSFYKIAAFVIRKPVTLVLQRNFIKNEMSGTPSSFLNSQNLKIGKRRMTKYTILSEHLKFFVKTCYQSFFSFPIFLFWTYVRTWTYKMEKKAKWRVHIPWI